MFHAVTIYRTRNEVKKEKQLMGKMGSYDLYGTS